MMPRSASLPLYRDTYAAGAGGRRPPYLRRGKAIDAVRLIDWTVVGLLLLAVISVFTLSAGVLTNWKIHYLTSGGNFLEKLHPATYATFLASLLLLLRN